MKITIETKVNGAIEKVWDAWTTPADIVEWNAASEDWCCPRAVNDLRVNGSFNYRMEARDGSFGFDFEGTYTRVEAKRLIEYSLDDGRLVQVEFEVGDGNVILKESFDAENEHSAEQQRQGWTAILERFTKHVESKPSEAKSPEKED